MGKFIIKKAKEGLSFSFVASDGNTLGSSEVYTSKASVKGGIASVKKNAGAAVEDLTIKDHKVEKTPKWEVFKDKAGGFRFRLIATNGKNVIHTSAYKSHDDAVKALTTLKKTAVASGIEDQSLAEKAAAKPAAKKAAAKKPAAKKATAKKPAAKKAPAKKPAAKK